MNTCGTDWESHYQAHDTPWDKGAAHPAMGEVLAQTPITGRVLVPGCGLGHDVRALAAAGAQPLGIDIAPSAIALAQGTPAAGAEEYAMEDLFALPPERVEAFDWVWEHTCFCAIAPARRPDYVRAVAAALRPGGHLAAVFYLDPGQSSPDEGPPFETSLVELDRLFSPLFRLEREWLPARTYAGREGREWIPHLPEDLTALALSSQEYVEALQQANNGNP